MVKYKVQSKDDFDKETENLLSKSKQFIASDSELFSTNLSELKKTFENNIDILEGKSFLKSEEQYPLS